MSDNVHYIEDLFRGLKDTNSDQYKGGGDGGGTDMIEHRVGRLETQVDRLQSDMTDVKAALARIETKLDSKIDYKWLTVYVLGIIAVIMRSEIASWVSSMGTS
ncbi:hypothetical protein JMM61_20655 [Rhodovulum sulfidophilum]|uniref:hypothetical protein n=1 Tax=Rhodovulum sulfidophilum TaxID=35806 RepID=UPI00138A164D|nr:hypothetical protein [Rhodovulum sulfidophilum]MBL3587726.1 hypothetical protein [Rhodovulum sulfidophilum]NDK37039.1 hypothetical protein [Rhodovulum sulfidophilum]